MSSEPRGEGDDATDVDAFGGHVERHEEGEEVARGEEEEVGVPTFRGTVRVKMRHVGVLLEDARDSLDALRDGRRAVASGEMSKAKFHEMRQELRREMQVYANAVLVRVRQRDEEEEKAARLRLGRSSGDHRVRPRRRRRSVFTEDKTLTPSQVRAKTLRITTRTLKQVKSPRGEAREYNSATSEVFQHIRRGTVPQHSVPATSWNSAIRRRMEAEAIRGRMGGVSRSITNGATTSYYAPRKRQSLLAQEVSVVERSSGSSEVQDLIDKIRERKRLATATALHRAEPLRLNNYYARNSPRDWRTVRVGDGTFDNIVKVLYQRGKSNNTNTTDDDNDDDNEDDNGGATVEEGETEEEGEEGETEEEKEGESGRRRRMNFTKERREICASRQKVCVGFFGITRSTNVTYHSAWRHILNPIRDSGAKLVTFLHTYKLQRANNIRAGEVNVELDGDEWKLLKPDVTKFDAQDKTLDDALMHSTVRALIMKGRHPSYLDMTRLAFKGTMMNIGRQGHSLFEVSKLMRDKRCTRVVFARPDVLFIDDIDTRLLLDCKIHPSTWHIPDFAHYGGINDRLAFGDYDSMMMYGSMLFQMKNYAVRSKMQKESFLYALSVKHGMRVNLFNMCFVRIRATHEPSKLDIGQCCGNFNNTVTDLEDLAELGVYVEDIDDTYIGMSRWCDEKKRADELRVLQLANEPSVLPLGEKSMEELNEVIVNAEVAAAANAATEVEGIEAAAKAAEVVRAAAAKGEFDQEDMREAEEVAQESGDAVALKEMEENAKKDKTDIFLFNFRLRLSGASSSSSSSSLGKALVGTKRAPAFDLGSSVFALVALVTLFIFAAVRVATRRKHRRPVATRVGKLAWTVSVLCVLAVLLSSLSSSSSSSVLYTST